MERSGHWRELWEGGAQTQEQLPLPNVRARIPAVLEPEGRSCQSAGQVWGEKTVASGKILTRLFILS